MIEVIAALILCIANLIAAAAFLIYGFRPTTLVLSAILFAGSMHFARIVW